MEARQRNILEYLTEANESPFGLWIEKLRDQKGQAVIRTRIGRVQAGNFGTHRSVGNGVYELVIDFGPGYRVYYGEDEDDVVLLGGGDKGTQSSDIKDSKRRWEDYNA